MLKNRKSSTVVMEDHRLSQAPQINDCYNRMNYQKYTAFTLKEHEIIF
jgi:hypothetical protein